MNAIEKVPKTCTVQELLETKKYVPNSKIYLDKDLAEKTEFQESCGSSNLTKISPKRTHSGGNPMQCTMVILAENHPKINCILVKKPQQNLITYMYSPFLV